MRLRSLGLIGLLGGVGGAVAWLSHPSLSILAAAQEPRWITINNFGRWIVMGAAQGGILALVTMGSVILLSRQHPLIKWIVTPIIGWSAGWISYIPCVLNNQLLGSTLEFPDVLQYVLPNAIFWPFVGPGTISLRQPLYAFLWPLHTFGLIGLLYYALYAGSHSSVNSFRRHLFIGVGSGLAGSLVFVVPSFSSFPAAVFGLVYGALWGSLVGFGVWKVQQPRAS